MEKGGQMGLILTTKVKHKHTRNKLCRQKETTLKLEKCVEKIAQLKFRYEKQCWPVMA